MAWKKIASCVAELLAAGRSPETPAAVIYRGTSASQKTLISTLERLPGDIAKEKLVPPLLVILGDVVLLRKELAWFESRPLFGLRVLMTRSPQGAGQYASELRELGAEIAFAECTEVVAATADQVKGVETAARELHRYDWLFFTSANAVRYFFAVLDGLQMDSRDCAGLHIAAVGQATAGALSARGLRADLLASGKSGAELAQLLCNKVKNEAKSARILFPRSAVGRKEPVEILEAAGLRCDLVTPYNNRSIDEISPLLRDSLAKLKGGQIGAALFFSPSQVHALIQIDPSLKSHLVAIPVVAAIGKTTAAALEGHGIEVQVVPTKLSGKSLAEQIAYAFSSRSG
ncbi:MAG: uroporphyrinogen-III synthase [Kofleriaceae bacterium]|nr:uroporphyrinogen-III synthase [Kofleriaceae bacterium]